MGSTPRAHLAYGYDLGYIEDFKAAERDEYGAPQLPWFGDDDGSWDFGAQVEARLENAGSRGVELMFSGGEDLPGWVLTASGSESSAAWSEATPLNVIEMECRPADEGWDDKLTAALTALGITPTQPAANWLVYPTYG
jgi:hypothetical protein